MSNFLRLNDLIAGRDPRSCSVSLQADMAEAAAVMAREKRHAVAVLDEGKPEGLVTCWDLLHHFTQAGGPSPEPRHVTDGMIAVPASAGPQTDLAEALEILESGGSGHLAVVEEGRLVAMVDERELLRGLVKALQDDNNHLREYIDHLHHAGQD
jgi:CBS domain-containing protein